MKKIFAILILAVIVYQFADAKSTNDNTDKIKALEEKCYVLQNKQVKADNNLRKLVDTNSVRYAVSDSGDMRSLVFQVFLRLQS